MNSRTDDLREYDKKRFRIEIWTGALSLTSVIGLIIVLVQWGGGVNAALAVNHEIGVTNRSEIIALRESDKQQTTETLQRESELRKEFLDNVKAINDKLDKMRDIEKQRRL